MESMDKKTTLGFLLIGLVLIVWMWVQTPPSHQPATPQRPDSGMGQVKPRIDSTRARRQEEPSQVTAGAHFSHLTQGKEKVIVVETDLYRAELTTRGGVLRKWELKKYSTWDKYPVQLVAGNQGGDLSLLFTSSDGKLINTRDLFFHTDLKNWVTIHPAGNGVQVVDLVLPLSPSGSIIKRFTFRDNDYAFDLQVIFHDAEKAISNFEYQLVWEHGLRYAERNSVDESAAAFGYAFSGGELLELDGAEDQEREVGGATDWVATTNRYFALGILSLDRKAEGAYLKTHKGPLPDNGVQETHTLALKMPLRSASDTSRFLVFLGPLDYRLLKSYGRDFDQIISLGAVWIIRPIAEFILIPLIQAIHAIIPNYGVVIVVFSLIIKIALHPLSKTSMKSMKRMQALQPMMSEIREKYKDDPQKMNQQVMNLYRDYGVNPASGCLPLLLQMPILFALYSVFRSSIDLRQAFFVGWITDLSVPDVLLTLPFPIPLFGITELSGLALGMSITMFVQQKMTVTDPRQAAMVYIMPVMFLLLFNGFPAGLNLYYFVFNLLSIAQQVWVNKHQKDEPLKKIERKKQTGILARLAQQLPKK
jgi:YidC/Oxa1 family membrane protein insertase